MFKRITKSSFNDENENDDYDDGDDNFDDENARSKQFTMDVVPQTLHYIECKAVFASLRIK